MNSSLEEYVRLAAPHLDTSIVSRTEIERILQIARRLPPVRSFGFECRLASTIPQADILLRFTQHDDSQQALLEYLEERSRDGVDGNSFAWRAAREFCRRWVDESSPFARQIAAVWLELDLFGSLENHPAPCVFFDFARRSTQRERTIRDLLPLVHSSTLPKSFDQNLSRCLSELPSSAWVFSLGAMFSRGPTTVRLCLGGIRPRELLSYVTKVGWDGPMDQIAWMIENLTPNVDWIAVALSLDDRILPKLGIELTLGGDWIQRQVRWRGILDQLVVAGLSSEEKRDAILGWCGHEHALRSATAWPDHLLQLSASSGGDALSTFLRRISHVKLGFQAGHAIEAKAYLEFMHSWLQRDARTGKYFLNEVLNYERPASPSGAVPSARM